jgi:hypothetical protein
MMYMYKNQYHPRCRLIQIPFTPRCDLTWVGFGLIGYVPNTLYMELTWSQSSQITLGRTDLLSGRKYHGLTFSIRTMANECAHKIDNNINNSPTAVGVNKLLFHVFYSHYSTARYYGWFNTKWDI